MSEYKKITSETYRRICDAASVYAGCYRGSEPALVAEARLTSHLIKEQRKTVTRLPKEYTIIYMRGRKFGGNGFVRYHMMMYSAVINSRCTMRETDKSYIVESDYSKTVISKDKVLAFVW